MKNAVGRLITVYGHGNSIQPPQVVLSPQGMLRWIDIQASAAMAAGTANNFYSAQVIVSSVNATPPNDNIGSATQQTPGILAAVTMQFGIISAAGGLSDTVFKRFELQYEITYENMPLYVYFICNGAVTLDAYVTLAFDP